MEKCLILNLDQIQTVSQEAREHKFTHKLATFLDHKKANKVQTAVTLMLAVSCLCLAPFNSNTILPY